MFFFVDLRLKRWSKIIIMIVLIDSYLLMKSLLALETMRLSGYRRAAKGKRS
tara:strand:- start:1400 stop:1555 length:156 start_codon:yes stop_codon:yes gene_type:complete